MEFEYYSVLPMEFRMNCKLIQNYVTTKLQYFSRRQGVRFLNTRFSLFVYDPSRLLEAWISVL